ncbi:hypothetical protein AU387_15635 [Bacillus halotolerans]|uniref:hypothetical protein n=1 Tax=Bacillus halotolerans TaxID=260554 RepID=UPI00075099D7|nr:hypothetical protein AU387_15635 [Bacillus halotolerans]
MTKIHVLADETLGGIKREYVEVDRKAEVIEKIVSIFGNCPYYSEKEYGKVIDVDIDDAEVEFESKYEDESWYILHGAYRVLEPTDIVHIDGGRYELTERKAEVGEKILTTQTQLGRLPVGKVLTVTDVFVDDSVGEWGVGIVVKTNYRVLVPVESAEADEPQPADLIDVVSNLAARVADLERENKKLHAALDEDMKIRSENTRRYLALKDEIDTLHKDNRTLGEELERLKESATGVKGEKLFTADELAAIIERLLMRP